MLLKGGRGNDCQRDCDDAAVVRYLGGLAEAVPRQPWWAKKERKRVITRLIRMLRRVRRRPRRFGREFFRASSHPTVRVTIMSSRAMAGYRIYYADAQNRFYGVDVVSAETDEQALKMAKPIAARRLEAASWELWLNGRRVYASGPI